MEQVRDAAASRIACTVEVGYAYGARPRVNEAVARARNSGAARVIVAQYVLAPGHFSSLVANAGGDVTTDRWEPIHAWSPSWPSAIGRGALS